MSGEHMLFRPPGDADSLIIRVAEGCPWNCCTFCGMYKGVQYKFPGLGKIEEEILLLCRGFGGKADRFMFRTWAPEETRSEPRRIFLADGDLIISV